MHRLLQVAAALCVLAAGAAEALTVQRLDTRFDHGVYSVSLDALLAAPPAAVSAVLRDYAAYPSLDHRIRSSERLADEPDGTVLIRTLIHACAAFFCRTVERVERVEQLPGGLVATVVPGRSDVRRGLTRTRWQLQGSGTQVSYEAEFEPDFWVPAVIGRTLVLDTLRESTLELFGNVESRAREH